MERGKEMSLSLRGDRVCLVHDGPGEWRPPADRREPLPPPVTADASSAGAG